MHGQVGATATLPLNVKHLSGRVPRPAENDGAQPLKIDTVLVLR